MPEAVLVALLSFNKISVVTSSPETYASMIESLDEKRNTVKTKIREGAIAGSVSGIFLIGFKALEGMIENSDFI